MRSILERAMRETRYASELATAELKDCRIERIHLKKEDRDEIRFSWWPNGKMAMRPLDLPENELLELIRLAVAEGVFTDAFLSNLRQILGSTTTGG
jgi:hypothetical protein